MMEWVYLIILGAVAGWLAGLFMRGGGSGLLVNIIVGVVGAYLGGFVFRLLGLSAHGLLGMLITATVGAMLLLLLLGMLKK